MAKLLSIVIVNYNYGRFLRAALESVVNQEGFDECELIVVDGGSSDESVSIIKQFEKKIAWWCSERDAGQSDAFNKGFAKASGKYLTWLNADDVLAPGAIKAILCAVKRHPDVEWFTGNFYQFETGSKQVGVIGWGPHVYPRWMQRKNSPLVVFGPSTIFARALFDRIGGFDVNLHLMMDIDMWIRFMVAGVKQHRINHFIWAFRLHGESKTAEFGDHKLDEERRKRFALEDQLSFTRHGYRCSRFWRYAVLLLRLIDGSMVRRYYYMLTKKVP